MPEDSTDSAKAESGGKSSVFDSVMDFFVGLYVYMMGGALVFLLGLLSTLTIIGAWLGIPLMYRGYSLIQEGWSRAVPDSLQFSVGPSEEEMALRKGEAKFGDCPFCGGDIEFHEPTTGEMASGDTHMMNCRDCEGEWSRTANLRAKYTCTVGPSEYEGETKHRNEWEAITP